MKRKKIKEITKAIFVRESMKMFLEKQKLILKDCGCKFFGVSETLLYYLEDSELFKKDWLDYETEKIFKFNGEDLLGLLTKCNP